MSGKLVRRSETSIYERYKPFQKSLIVMEKFIQIQNSIKKVKLPQITDSGSTVSMVSSIYLFISTYSGLENRNSENEKTEQTTIYCPVNRQINSTIYESLTFMMELWKQVNFSVIFKFAGKGPNIDYYWHASTRGC